MDKKVLILSSQSGDWEGLFIDGNLIDEGHKLGGSSHPSVYWLDMSELHKFKSDDLNFKEVTDEDEEYLCNCGSFPINLNELKGDYEN